jgi:hypothetical protein
VKDHAWLVRSLVPGTGGVRRAARQMDRALHETHCENSFNNGKELMAAQETSLLEKTDLDQIR